MWGLVAVVFTNGDATVGGQLLGIVAIFAWTFIVSSVVWYLIKMVIGVRISAEEEYEGADATETGIEAYPEFSRG